jgi:hypothetical protein
VARDKTSDGPKPQKIGNRWAGPAMLISAIFGLLWIVTFYVFNGQVSEYPSFLQWYDNIGSWNIVIGMGFIIASFGFAMKWE